MGIPNNDNDEIPLDNLSWKPVTSNSVAFKPALKMFVKQIYAFGLLYSTRFGALRLLQDIGHFKKDLLTFLLPPRPSQDLTPHLLATSTHGPHSEPDYLDLENQGWEPVTNQNSHQFQEVQHFIKPQPDYPKETTTTEPTLPTTATDKTLYREDVLNKGKLHDKKQRVDSGNCVGNKFCPGIDHLE